MRGGGGEIMREWGNLVCGQSIWTTPSLLGLWLGREYLLQLEAGAQQVGGSGTG